MTLRPEVILPRSRHLIRLFALAAALVVAHTVVHAVRVLRDLHSFDGGESKREIAQHATQRLALRAEHAGAACPTITDLVRHSRLVDQRDPWGNAYLVACASGRRHEVWVWSRGEDAVPGTADDVWSDR